MRTWFLNSRIAAYFVVLRRFNLLNALGLNSILGRTAVFAVVIILATVAVAWISDRKVGSAADLNAANQSERVQISHGARELSNLLWNTETQFQRYMIEPNAPLQIEIAFAVDDMIARSSTLNRQPWVIQNNEIHTETQLLLDDISALKSKLLDIMDIRADPLKVFPAMTLMVTKLNPLNTEFISIATLGVHEAEDNPTNPDQVRIGKLFGDIRYFWSQRINTFRLFAASRVGMFSTSVESSVSAATQDIDVFGRQLRILIDQLHGLDTQSKLGFQQAEALSQLMRVFDSWNGGFDEIRSVLTVKDLWRRDIPMLRDDIQPHFILLSEMLRKIEAAVEQSCHRRHRRYHPRGESSFQFLMAVDPGGCGAHGTWHSLV